MIYRINLQLFARGAGGEDRTEKATPKKRREARKKGQVFQSREITTTMVVLLVFISIRAFGTSIYKQLAGFAEKAFAEYPMTEDLFMPDILKRIFIDGILTFFRAAGPILLISLLTALVVNYAQVGFLFTTETLKPDFKRISPFSGMRRLFSMRAVVEMVKAVLKVVIIAWIAYSYLNGRVHTIMSLMDMDIMSVASFIGITAVDLAIRICIALLIMGAFDFAYQWWEFEKSMKMTKQEVKEEYKQLEGNPEVRAKIRQKQRQLSMRRMMQEVPSADVVITNPTHYACALKYDEKVNPAPVLLAKGQDYIALRIKEIARENDVEVVENRPLARTIYETVDIGQAIPPELYQAVAEVLAFVYSLKGKTMAG
jgi:flagellar biosynthetic protein FlhB